MEIVPPCNVWKLFLKGFPSKHEGKKSRQEMAYDVKSVHKQSGVITVIIVYHTGGLGLDKCVDINMKSLMEYFCNMLMNNSRAIVCYVWYTLCNHTLQCILISHLAPYFLNCLGDNFFKLYFLLRFPSPRSSPIFLCRVAPNNFHAVNTRVISVTICD